MVGSFADDLSSPSSSWVASMMTFSPMADGARIMVDMSEGWRADSVSIGGGAPIDDDVAVAA